MPRSVPTDALTRRAVLPRPPSHPVQPGAFELTFDAALPRRLSTIAIHPDDKAVFDALQAWWYLRHGKRATQWEMFTLLLGEALSNSEGKFRDARIPGG